MTDTTSIAIISIIPSIIASVLTYFISKRKQIASEKIYRAKLESEIQSQSLTIVKSAMDAMRTELHQEIDRLRAENKSLHKIVEENNDKIHDLHVQLKASDRLVESMQTEMIALKSTIKMYEDEIARLRGLSINK